MRILFIGSVCYDDSYKADAPLPMEDKKYYPGDIIKFHDGSEMETLQAIQWLTNPPVNGNTAKNTAGAGFLSNAHFSHQVMGGSATNCSFTNAFLRNISQSDFEVHVYTALGDGPNSEKAKREFAGLGIYTHGYGQDSDFDIPVNYPVNGNNAKRAILIGATNYPQITPDDEERLRALIDEVDVVQIHTGIPEPALLAAKILKDKKDKYVIVDASKYTDVLDEVMESATQAILPDDLSVPGYNGSSPSRRPNNPDKVMKYIDRFENIKVGIVTCGKQPALLRMRDHSPCTYIVPTPTGPGLDPKDSTGAGDNLHSGYIDHIATILQEKGHLEFDDVRDALHKGMSVASYSICKNGRDWMRDFSMHTATRQTWDYMKRPLLGKAYQAVEHPAAIALQYASGQRSRLRDAHEDQHIPVH